MVNIQGISCRLGKQQVLREISFEAPRGEVTCVIGHNGCGKTTLLSILAGLNKNYSGRFTIRAGSTGIKLDEGMFDPGLRGGTNLKIAAQIRGMDWRETAPWLDRFELENEMYKRVKNYSLGMKNKLGLVQALMAGPELLILDEPTNGFDPRMRSEFYKLVEEKKKEGVTFLLTSHDFHELNTLADRLVMMRNGRVVDDRSRKSLDEEFESIDQYLAKL